MNVFLFFLPIVFYLGGWLWESYRFWDGKQALSRMSTGLLLFGWAAHSVLLVLVALEKGAEQAFLITAVAWLAIVVHYGLMRKVSSAVFPLVFPPLSIALLITAFFSFGGSLSHAPGQGWPFMSKTYLLPAHIISVLSGFALFGLGCLASIFYLYQEGRIKAKATGALESRLPSLARLENYNHTAITLGFFLLTIGLFLGLLVAGVETFSTRLFSLRQLIPTLTWLVYVAFLVIHDLQGRRGRFGAIHSIIGFGVVIVSLVFELTTLIKGA